MEIQQMNTNVTKASFEVSGVSRSGRVRKKSSKLIDFQSPDELESKKPKRTFKHTTPRYNGRGRPSNAVKARRALITEPLDDASQDDNDDDELDLALGGGFSTTKSAHNAFLDTDGENGVSDLLDEHQPTHNSAHSDNLLLAGGAADSDDELDNLVADLVEGVEAESLGADGNPNDQRVRQSLYMIEKSNKRKMLKDGKVITGKLERKDKGKSRYTAYSMWARELRKSGKFGKTQDLDFTSTARRLGELWANVSNKEKNAWRRKAKKLSSKERQRDKPAGNARKANLTPSLNHISNNTISNNNNAALNNNNTNFLNRATTSRTRKLAAERIKQQQEQQVIAQPTEVDSNSNNNGSSSPTTVTALRNKRTYAQRGKSKRITTNGNLSNARSNTNNNINNNNNNNKRLEPRKANTVAVTKPVEKNGRSGGSQTANAHTTTRSTQILKSNQTKMHANALTTTTAAATTATTANAATQTIEPIDAAAHLKLLGESLTIIGERLKEHDGQIALSGSLSVLLDSLICSLGPLMCLTTYIPGLEKNQQLNANLAATLDNIAYVMPGL